MYSGTVSEEDWEPVLERQQAEWEDAQEQWERMFLDY